MLPPRRFRSAARFFRPHRQGPEDLAKNQAGRLSFAPLADLAGQKFPANDLGGLKMFAGKAAQVCEIKAQHEVPCGPRSGAHAAFTAEW
jgi:hypothetical protein